MTTNARLHHAAVRIAAGSFENVVEMFELLGCYIAYRQCDARWAMICQKGSHFDIQIIEVADAPREFPSRTTAHIAFLSDTPQGDIAHVARWAAEKKLRFVQGGWSDRELWFDLPDLFIDSVIEIIDTRVVEAAKRG